MKKIVVSQEFALKAQNNGFRVHSGGYEEIWFFWGDNPMVPLEYRPMTRGAQQCLFLLRCIFANDGENLYTITYIHSSTDLSREEVEKKIEHVPTWIWNMIMSAQGAEEDAAYFWLVSHLTPESEYFRIEAWHRFACLTTQVPDGLPPTKNVKIEFPTTRDS